MTAVLSCVMSVISVQHTLGNIHTGQSDNIPVAEFKYLQFRLELLP